MAIDKEVIQAVRLKRSSQQIEALLTQGNALAEQLLQRSGLRQRGVDPKYIRATPADIEKLLEITEDIESKERLLVQRQPSRRDKLQV